MRAPAYRSLTRCNSHFITRTQRRPSTDETQRAIQFVAVYYSCSRRCTRTPYANGRTSKTISRYPATSNCQAVRVNGECVDQAQPGSIRVRVHRDRVAFVIRHEHHVGLCCQSKGRAEHWQIAQFALVGAMMVEDLNSKVSIRYIQSMS